MAQSRGRSRRSREVRVAPRAHRPFCTSQATRFGERHVLVPLGLCSLLGSITVLCASAFVQFIGRLIGAADFDQLRTPAFYLVAAVLVATGVLQACPPPTHPHTPPPRPPRVRCDRFARAGVFLAGGPAPPRLDHGGTRLLHDLHPRRRRHARRAPTPRLPPLKGWPSTHARRTIPRRCLPGLLEVRRAQRADVQRGDRALLPRRLPDYLRWVRPRSSAARARKVEQAAVGLECAQVPRPTR